MIRAIFSFAGWSLAAALTLASLTPDTMAKEPNPIVQLAKKLDQTVDFPGIDDPKTTLRAALDMLTKRYDVHFFINERAFQLEGGPIAAGAPRRERIFDRWVVALDQPETAKNQKAKEKAAPAPAPVEEDAQDVSTWLVAKKPIPKMNQARLSTVLKRILARLNTQAQQQNVTETNATYVIRRDGIEITTLVFKEIEFYRHRLPADHAPPSPIDDAVPEGLNAGFRFFPLVQVEFDKRPLEEALQELANATECSVVLDPRAAEKAKPVTATLINLPLDTAVEMLANMSGLSVLLRDRGLYVTTKANVEAMQKELAERVRPQAAFNQMAGQPQMQAGGIGGFGGMGGIAGLQGGAGFGGGGMGGFQSGGGNSPQPPVSQAPTPSPKQPSAQDTGKPAPSDLAKMQAEIAKLQAEIAKLQAELSQLQLKRQEPKQEKGDQLEANGAKRPDTADRRPRYAFMKPRVRPTGKG